MLNDRPMGNMTTADEHAVSNAKPHLVDNFTEEAVEEKARILKALDEFTEEHIDGLDKFEQNNLFIRHGMEPGFRAAIN